MVCSCCAQGSPSQSPDCNPACAGPPPNHIELPRGGSSVYPFDACAMIQSGTQRVSFIRNVMGQGKLYTLRRRRSALTILRAARSASIPNAILNSEGSVIGVCTKPGQMVVTAML